MARDNGTTTRALAIVDGYGSVPALSQNVAEEMQGLQFTFDRVRIPAGGGLVFELPGEDDDGPQSVKEIVGVIADHHAARSYWREAFSGQGRPPDCASVDGITGSAIEESGLEWAGAHRECATCPMNRWGSDDKGRGKACKELHRLYILQEGQAFPLLLTLPPTSLKSLSNYLGNRILAQGLRSYQVVTRIALRRAQNTNGIAYSQAVFSAVGRLGQEAAARMAAYARSLQAITRSLPATADDYDTGDREAAEEVV
jgi:hypothetical protein